MSQFPFKNLMFKPSLQVETNYLLLCCVYMKWASHGLSFTSDNHPAKNSASANPDLHLLAASLMGVDVRGVSIDQAGQILAQAIIDLMKTTGIPNGLSAVGYQPVDIPKLVNATLPQHRVTKLSPIPVDSKVLTHLFEDSMVCW